MMDCELFLLESWTKDEKRCEKAGVPKEKLVHKSNPNWHWR